MTDINVIVQASSTSWHGGADLCMNHLNGQPVVKTTIEKFLNHSPAVSVTIAAPEFDKGVDFCALIDSRLATRCHVFKGDAASPLKRIVDATASLADSDYIIRVDGLHFPVLVGAVVAMLEQAKLEQLDCIKFPDDYPVQFSADVYRIGALRQLLAGDIDAVFHVHPKYALFADTVSYRCAFYQPPVLSDGFLTQVRKQAETVYIEPRMEVSDKKISAGDQLSFHYELALQYLPQAGQVLDIACGGGYGSRMMASDKRSVTGGDIESEVIAEAKQQSKEYAQVSFCVTDVTAMQFGDASFDAVVSMETIEHVDDAAYLSEISRVLKSGGVFILSTPQNSLGHIPVNAVHLKEYTRQELQGLCQPYFEVEEVIGLKQGRVIIANSPAGGNMMMVCRKR
ncbi:methyltransferase domain-containing protein [Dasania marina]|uniref:methyltransferase domain-containing protein n=1 Tax=Dasania marina TaxID=471499 RepID=UPI000381E788|nr:methyltransferase domain-containing protein [Dasania marina]